MNDILSVKILRNGHGRHCHRSKSRRLLLRRYRWISPSITRNWCPIRHRLFGQALLSSLCPHYSSLAASFLTRAPCLPMPPNELYNAVSPPLSIIRNWHASRRRNSCVCTFTKSRTFRTPPSDMMPLANDSASHVFCSALNQNGQDVYWMCSVDDGGPWLLRLTPACPTCDHRYDPAVDATWQHPNNGLAESHHRQ